jgi:Prokaryotic STING domain/CAP12/Pycsar effector protein, TIR domain
MENKPTVFIGSSTEGLPVANAIKSIFGQEADVEVWNSGGIFTKNQSFLRSLMDMASLFEFAVLVFSNDDISLIRGQTYETARDNVLFEFGLFLGKLGPRRVYTLVEKDLKIPTELDGISLDSFSRTKNGNPTAGFSKTCSKIVSSIIEYHKNTTEFSNLPSTALAIGYFQNFLSRVCDRLDDFEPVIIADRKIEYSSFKLHVVIPDQLELLDDDNMKSIIKRLTLVRIKNSKFREFPFYMQAIPPEGTKHLDLIDIPTTMRTSRETIRRIFSGEFVGRNDLQMRAERREAANFERTLQLLLEERPIWKKSIEFQYLSDLI